MDNKTSDDLLCKIVAVAGDRQTQHIEEATRCVLSNEDKLRKLAIKWKKLVPDRAQVHMAGQVEFLKNNLAVQERGNSVYDVTSANMSGSKHPFDFLIKHGKKILQGFGIKSSNKASHSNRIKQFLQNRVDKGTLKASDYTKILCDLEQELTGNGTRLGGGAVKSEALLVIQDKQVQSIASKLENKAVLNEMHQAGMEAGRNGAIAAGGVSCLGSIGKLYRGDAGPGEIVAQAAVDAAKGYAKSYITTSLSKGISHTVCLGAEKAVGGEVAKVVGTAFTKSNAPVAIAAAVVQSGKSLAQYLNGEINEEQLLSDVSQIAITGASSFYYGALGQALIPIPLVGFFVGSTVGYFVGNMLHQSGLISLGEASVVKVARERREHVEALCMTAIPLMRAHRLELETVLTEHFAESQHLFTAAFDDLESSLIDWDADRFLAGLESVNNTFGAALPFKSFDEFDKFMIDDSQAFVL